MIIVKGKMLSFVHGLKQRKIFNVFICLLIVIPTTFSLFSYSQALQEKNQVKVLSSQKALLTSSLTSSQNAYKALKTQNQYVINQQLKSEIAHIHSSYKDSISAYQNILDLKAQKQDTTDMEKLYGAIVAGLSLQDYASADAQLKDLQGQIAKTNDALAAAQAASSPGSAPAPLSNTPPSSGFSYQSVQTDTGTFSTEIISADLSNTKVIVDTASAGDCSNNCPVLPLADYVSRSGAYAGINGTFFCPVDYPSCAGKTGSFDTLLMNKNKVYFNSANNVYSTVPVAIFGSGFARFIGQSSGWGRDTSVDAVIAMQPGLILGGQIVYGGSSNSKFESRGARTFLANKGATVYIGVIFNATMADSAHVLHTLGMDNAINLDEGGSTALWYGGYKAGPGRSIPNAVLFVRR